MGKYMIEIDNVTKRYILGQIGGTTLHEELQRRRAKRRGKEDPTKKIGAKSYADGEEFWALSGVSFKVKKGERVGIIGHNGAGKSTLLKLLSRVTAPTSGEIGLDGRVTSMLEVGTGFNGELTGRENIYMNGAILGMTKKEIDAKMDDIIEFSECGQFIDTPVKRYSSGMYVKLAFSVAAHLDSEIMIMDEVLAVGDMAFQKKCLDKMNDVSRNEGRTILYVSHNMNTIRQLCDRCVVMDKGKIIFDGTPEKAISIYLKDSSEMSVTNDLSGKHEGYNTDEKIHFDLVTMQNKETPMYKQGEHIFLKINFVATCSLPELMVRISVKTPDKTVIGLTSLDKPIAVKKGSHSIFAELDLSHLAPGKYVGKLIGFSANNYGGSVNHDVVEDAFIFEILQNKDSNCNIEWNSNWWGYINFPCIHVKEIINDL